MFRIVSFLKWNTVVSGFAIDANGSILYRFIQKYAIVFSDIYSQESGNRIAS